jgi:hypothetical protein
MGIIVISIAAMIVMMVILFVVTQAPLDNQTAPPIRDDVALKEAREALDIALKNIAWKERVIQDCRTIRDEDFQALCKIRDERDELASQLAKLQADLDKFKLSRQAALLTLDGAIRSLQETVDIL